MSRPTSLIRFPLLSKILTCGGSSVSSVLNVWPEMATHRLSSLSTAAEDGVSSPRLEYSHLVTRRHHYLVGIRRDGRALRPFARLGAARFGFHIGHCSDGGQSRGKCNQHRTRQHPHAFLLAFGLFPGGPGFIGVTHSMTKVRMNAMTSAMSSCVSVVFQDGMYALLPTARPPSIITAAKYSSGIVSM